MEEAASDFVLVFSDLPSDVLYAITERLVPQDVLQCRLVNKEWRDTIDSSPQFWDRVIFHLPPDNTSVMGAPSVSLYVLLTNSVAQRIRHFRANCLTDSLLSVIISKCPNITRLDLSLSWQISDARFPQLAEEAPQLRLLNLTGCRQVSDMGLQFLSCMVGLEHLSLSRCTKLSPHAAPVFENFVSLQTLDLSYCAMADESLLHLQKAKKITSLNLAGVEGLTADGVGTLATMTSLRKLSLAKCGAQVDFVHHLAGLTSLEELHLDGCRLADYMVESLAGLVNLQTLTLVGCTDLTDNAFGPLHNLSALTDLDLSECHMLTHHALIPFSNCLDMRFMRMLECRQLMSLEPLTHWTRLQVLMLSNSRKGVNDAEIGQVLARNPGIQRLHLGACISMLGPGLSAFRVPATAQSLRALDLGGCFRLEPSALSFLKLCVNLQYLNISSVALDEDTVAQISCCRDLRKLNLNYCKGLTNASIGHLLPLVRLFALMVNGAGITDAAFDDICKLTNLQELHLVGCDDITNAGLARLTVLTKLSPKSVLT